MAAKPFGSIEKLKYKMQKKIQLASAVVKQVRMNHLEDIPL
jgi:hypothetical protein